MVVDEARLEEYGRAAVQLLPPGYAWRWALDSTGRAVLEALAYLFAEWDGRALDLVEEWDPRTTVEHLTAWEAFLNLPNPCDDLPPTTQLRRAAVVAAFTRTGGASLDHFVAFAAALGYTVTVEDYRPFECGRSTMGDRLYTDPWCFSWTVHAPVATPTFFRSGQSVVGERLVEATNEPLECHFQETKPAHTIVLFDYSAPWEGYAPWETLFPDPAAFLVSTPPVLLTTS